MGTPCAQESDRNVTRGQAQKITNEINAVLKANNARFETDMWAIFLEDGFEPCPFDIEEIDSTGDGTTTFTFDPEGA